MHYVNDIPYETEEEADAAMAQAMEDELARIAQEAAEDEEYDRTRPLNADEVLAAMIAPMALADALPDDALARMAPYFPDWESGKAYAKSDICSFGMHTYRCLQDHTSQDTWTPDAAPSLWAMILPGQDGSVGEWVQPDSTNPYMRGDRVTHNGQTWQSSVDNNVWEPGVYGWDPVTG